MDNEYIKLQVDGSDWSYNSRWGDQMVDAINDLFSKKNINENDSVLDIGCGEGRGLSTFKNLGFYKICGVDLSEEKLTKARKESFEVYNCDFHDLRIFDEKQFDYIFCSHTLEHAYDIRKAILSFLRITKKEIYIIIPINESEEFVKLHNPSHTSFFTDGKNLLNILTELNLNFEHITKKRLCDEMWIKIIL